MLESIDDLINIESKIEEVQHRRNDLAKKLKSLEDAESQFVTEMEELNTKIDAASREIGQIRSLSEIEPLRSKYGKLKILDQIEAVLKKRETAKVEREIFDKLSSIFDNNFTANFETFSNIRHDIKRKGIETPKILKIFNEQLVAASKGMIEKFKYDLLNSKWDTLNFSSSKKVTEDLRCQSTALYNLQMLWLPRFKEDECGPLWCFQCISNNFKIKFMYHFSNPNFGDSGLQNQSIELYFKFLDRYLESTLYTCVDIFNDEEAGITKELVHKEFINHTLSPMRSKINQTLSDISKNNSKESLRIMIVLISQIFINDNALAKKHYYKGIGLISLIPEDILESWLTFELESTFYQYERIVNTPVKTNGIDLVNLLENMYHYFEPCFNLDYDTLNTYKLQIVSKIFLGLIERYNKYIISPDPSLLQLTEEKQFEITICKLGNCIKLRDCARKLSLKPIFIDVTSTFNTISSSNYESVFSDSLATLETTAVTVRESIIHRWKKLLKSSLGPYLRFNLWQEVHHTATECSTELVPAVKMISETRKILESFSLPKNINMTILYEMISQWIFYLKDYVLKVNNFTKQGIDQLFLDYMELLNLLKPADALTGTVMEGGFLEFLKILKLKYDGDKEKISFVDKSYLSESSEYAEVRVRLNLKYISSSELGYALYKIL